MENRRHKLLSAICYLPTPHFGFTLMEVLVTIVIMGVLSTIGFSSYQSTQKKGRDLNRKASLTSVAKALESYMNDKGVYPPGSIDGKILWCGTVDAPNSESCSWGDPLTDPSVDEEGKTVYMASLPKDMVGSQTYFYEAVQIDGFNKGYRLYGRLENEKDPELIQYTTNCSSDPASFRYCNYVLTSETVALPTPTALATLTPTESPTPTSTVTPTLSPTPSCLAAGSVCTGGGTACCSGVCTTFYRDQDGDTYGAGAAVQRCPPFAGYVTNNTDCYDSNANARPGSPYCGTTHRGDGSYDYNCTAGQTYCGSTYYASFTGTCCNDHGCMNPGDCKFVNPVAQAACGSTGRTVNPASGTAGGFKSHCNPEYGECCQPEPCTGYTKDASGTQGCQ